MEIQTPTSSIPILFLVGYLLAGIMSTVLTVYIVRFRWQQQAARAFAAILILVSIWALGYACRMVSPSLTMKLIWTQLAWVGIAFSPVAILAFSLIFTGRGDYLSRKRLAGLLIIPAITQLLLLTNASHQLFYQAVWLHSDDGLQLIASRGGLWFYGIHLPYSWGLYFLATVLLVQFAVTATALYRRQATALLVGAIVPWIVNGTFLAGIRIHPELDPTPVGIAVGMAVIGAAVFRDRFLALIPVAHEQVLDELDECIFILDDADRLVDVNASGKAFLATHTSSDWVLGNRAVEIFPQRVLDEINTREETVSHREVNLEVDGSDRWYLLRIYPFLKERYTGTIVLLSDMSAIKRRQRALERKNESLEQVGHIMAHDVRNPLSVANGYLEVLEDSAAIRDLPTGTQDEVESAISTIEHAHERIETIIDDVLLLAQNEHELPETETVGLERIARSAWEHVQSSPLTLEVESSAAFEGNPDQLQRVFENLFRNTIEHGETATTIRIGTTPNGFYIEDDGVGSSVERTQTLFDVGVSEDVGGTGLGLAIVRDVINAHGWTIEPSTSDDGGLRFEIHGVEFRDS